MSEEQKNRLKQFIKTVLQILLLGAAYAIFVKITGWGLPCPIKLVTGKYCPGCGISRMLLAMLSLDFENAFHANRLLFFLLPVILFYGLIKGIQYIKTGENKQTLAEQLATLVVCIITIAFWVMRNMEKFSFLAPME